MSIRRYPRNVARFFTVVASSVVLASSGLAQTSSMEEMGAEADKTPDEIIVYGETNVINLRNALYRAEESFFDLYNSLNSHDEFDVECKKRQISIQERRKAHRCAPSFALEYEAWVAANFIRNGMRNGFSGMASPAFANLEYQARVRVKEKMMWAEIKDLIEANPDFMEEIKELQRANRALAAEKERRGPCPKLFCRD